VSIAIQLKIFTLERVLEVWEGPEPGLMRIDLWITFWVRKTSRKIENLVPGSVAERDWNAVFSRVYWLDSVRDA
jgi:hypothetical protein